uniref:NBAS subunit of NRZ tethering complex n=1 Tax=Sinocyclocheilus rhinocerous TaxID=307959 RepID=A0A673GLC1_9TELE
MAGDIILEDEEENILHDLLINTEWPPETDTVCVSLCIFFLYFSPSSSTLPPGLVRLATKQLNWQLVLASNGKLLAVVQDQCRGVMTVLCWHMLDSTGTVRVFDLMGSELFIIPPAMSFPGDFSYAAAGLMFLEYTASAQWSAELLVITYSGQLKSYLVSVGTNRGFQENHTFSFSAHYSNGITTAIYHPGHRLLLVGGCESRDSDVSRASRCGITAWRVLSGSPHYKQVISYEDDISASQRRGFFRMPSFRLFSRHNSEQDGVFRMSLSPDGTVLAVIHFSGSLSLWDIPSFKLRGSWKQEEQIVFLSCLPQHLSLSLSLFSDKEQYQFLIDVSWWSETALILARCSGALTVSSVRTLKNVLGKSCEWFETSPRVTLAHDGGFLSLEVCLLYVYQCSHKAHEEVKFSERDLGDSTDGKGEKERETDKEKREEEEQDKIKATDSLEQKELCRSRLKLLCYLDRLATYDEILGGTHAAEQRFDAEFFKKFRNQNIVLSARTYARESNVQALDILFTYHGSELLQHWLAVFCNFPETTSPHEYSDLLPKCADLVDRFVYHFITDDCVCVLFFRGVVEPNPVDDCHFLYEEQPELERFRSAKPSITLLTEWYLTRAQDIESNSRQVDCALSLVHLGKEQNIPGLEVRCADLVTMETLVYETSCDLSLTLKELQQLRDIDKLRLLMKNVCFEAWMVPFLHRCEGQRVGSASTLLREYLVTLAKDDLAFPLKIFQHSKPDCHPKVIGDSDQLMSVALECIYSSERDDQLALCYDILECLPRGYGVAEVLEKHGLQKPISFVRNSQNTFPTALVCTCLTVCCLLRNPPVSESVWRSLLQDLLDMQQNVYTCLELETFFYFLKSEAVLGELSVKYCILNLLGLSVRSCLLLITDCPSLVQEELDFISVLPLQVHLRTDRLSLIKECISQCPTAYRQSTLLLSLARLLRVAGDDEVKRKGQVLTLLAEQALRCQDFKASCIHCQDLMAAGYSGGWDVCAQLGQCETYSQLSARQELMAFTLTHCPPSSIQNLLAASSSLQMQVLYQAVNYKIDPSQAQRTGCEMSEQAGAAVPGSINPTDLLHRTTARTIEVLTNTTMNTRAVLTAVSDSHWWRESLSLLRPLHGQAVERNRTGAANQNTNLERQGCSPFYEELFDVPYVNTSEDVYSSYDYTPQEDFAEVLLWTGKLTETARDRISFLQPKVVLLILCSVNAPFCLFLFQVLDANTCFEKQPPSALSLLLAAYYYSLQIYSRLASCFKDKCSPLYRVSLELIRLVTKHVTDHAGCDWGDEELQALISQLRLYSERLTDFTQAQVLQGLGRGVDVQRFSSDNQYKKETILGLAETLDESVYGISRSLAQRYSIPLWEVHMTHLEFLFTESGLSTKDIEDRTEALGLFETLKTDPESFYTHMTEFVYPSIAGTDQLRLLFYFTLLENCGCTNYFPQSAMKLDTHLKLLKKLKAVAVGLDYKKLTDEDSDPLKALEPVLTSQNVLSISKLAPRIPQKGGEAFTSSTVHATWLHKLFWEGDQHVLKKAPQSDHDFLHAYDTCAKYFDRLLPVDSVNFLDVITFSPEAANKLSVEARLDITKRAQKALKGISKKSKKKGNDDRSENSASSFDSALTHIQQSLAYLETLSHSFPLSLKTSQELLQKYSRIYDLSRSEQSKVRHLAVTMAMDGQPLERIQQLLAVSVGTSDLSPKTIVQDAVERIITALSGDKDTLKDYADPLKVPEGIVAAVHTNVQSGGNMVTSEDMLAWLRPFCGDDSKPGRPRIEVLQILEHSFSLSDQDIHLLVFFRSQAVLKACWPNRKVKNIAVADQLKFHFMTLEDLEYSHCRQMRLSLHRLETEQNPWVGLTSALLAHSSGLSQINIGYEVLTMCRSLYPTKHKLNPQCTGYICSLLLNAGIRLPALKLMTESEDEHLRKLTQDQIKNITDVTEDVCDSELLSLLLNAGMLISCVDTALYSSLVSHMLAQGEWDVEKVARDLHQAGHSAEAGSLLMSYRRSHPGQFTFNSALSVIRKYL